MKQETVQRARVSAARIACWPAVVGIGCADKINECLPSKAQVLSLNVRPLLRKPLVLLNWYLLDKIPKRDVSVLRQTMRLEFILWCVT